MNNTPSPEIPEGLLSLIPGITEGGAIIIGLIILLGLFLWFFGRVLAKRMEAALVEARETKKLAATVRDQVQNSHTINFRDDMDEKDRGSHVKLDQIVAQITGLREDMSRRFDTVNDRISGVDDRVTGIDRRLNRRGGPTTGTITPERGEN